MQLDKVMLFVEKIQKFFKTYFSSPPKTAQVPFAQNQKKVKLSVSEGKAIIKKLSNSYDTMKKTTNPETFFKQLHYSYDCILLLMSCKNLKFYKNSTPQEQYISLRSYMQSYVNDMIDRSYAKESEAAANLKTEKAKVNKMMKYFAKMETAFNHANEYWEGGYTSAGMMPHYTGELYTQANVQKLKDLKESVYSKLNIQTN